MVYLETLPRLEAEPAVTFEFLEGLINSLGERPIAIKLREELDDITNDDEVKLKKLHEKIKAVLDRIASLNQPRFEVVSAVKETDKNFVELEKETLKKIPSILERAEKAGDYLGAGGTAKVWSDPVEPSLCYKIIYNQKGYSKVNPVNLEMRFLSELSDLNVRGVRVPKPYFSVVSADEHVLVMERLTATNMDLVLEKKIQLPPNFNFKDFFAALENFLSQMHGRGIYHRDLRPRNIMVDTNTGMPYVIDFGEATKKFISDEDPYEKPGSGETVRFPDDDECVKELKKALQDLLSKK